MNRNRVAAGVPTGGQFAAHARADDTVSLVADFAAIQAAESALARRKAVVAMQLTAAEILAAEPTARYFELEYSHGSDFNLYGSAILDADGNQLTEGIATGRIDVDGFDEYLRTLPEEEPTTFELDDRGYVASRTRTAGWEWIEYGDTVRVDLHAVRAVDPAQISEGLLIETSTCSHDDVVEDGLERDGSTIYLCRTCGDRWNEPEN